jgi:SsrA-binding protein
VRGVKPEDSERKVLVRNRKARYDYAIEDSYEAGVSLVGSEVKSLRDAQASLVDAFAEIRGNEVWLIGAKINPYPWANQFNHEPMRPRRLLLHRQEIKRLSAKVREKGYTLVATEIYIKNGLIKVEIGLARGKKQHEKRDSKRAAEAQREMDAGKKGER